MATHKELIKEGADYYRDIEETIKRIKAHTAEIGMPGFEKGQIETKAAGSAQSDQIATKAKEQINKLYDVAKPHLQDLDKQIEAQRERMAAPSYGDYASAFLGGHAMPTEASADTIADATAKIAELQSRRDALIKNRDSQIGKVRSGAKDAQGAIDTDTKKQLKQQQMEHDRDLREQARQTAIEQQSNIASHAAAELQLQGRFLDAKLAMIQAGEKKEVDELRLTADKKEHDLIKGSKDWLAVEKDFGEKSAGIHQHARDQEAEARKDDTQWEIEQARIHAQEIADVKERARDEGLRAVGKTFQADKEQLDRQHTDRLAKIKADGDAEIKAHGEHRDEIKKRVDESIAAENQSYAVDSLAHQIEMMKSMGAVSMNASAVGGVGLDASAMTALGQPYAMREASILAHDRQIAGLQEKMGNIMPGVSSSAGAQKIDDTNIVKALRDIWEEIKKPIEVNLMH